MTTESEFQAFTAKAITNMGRLDQIVNGDATTTVTTDSGPVKSIAKLEADLYQETVDGLAGASVSTILGLSTALDAKLDKAFSNATSYAAGTVGAHLKARPILITDAPYNGKDDNSTDNGSIINTALATGRPVHLPKTSTGTYRISQPITTVSNAQLTMDDGVVIYYTGSGAAGVNLVGSHVKAVIGEVYAPNATSAIRYYDLEYSEIVVRRPGYAQQHCVLFDGDAQTMNCGNNRWVVGDTQAGSVPYGLRKKESATYTLEGEIWDLKVILSATQCGFRLGTSTSSQKIRWNTYRLAIDAQGITPMLIDVYQDYNNIELINWAGVSSPPVAHVRFNTGTGNCRFISGPGIQDPIKVLMNGTNWAEYSAQAGERILDGQTWFRKTASSGFDQIIVENDSSAGTTTKFAGVRTRGRDTVNSGKDVGYVRHIPIDANWVDSYVEIGMRRDDALTPALVIGANVTTPEGAISAKQGTFLTTRNGKAWLKVTGTGNTGWVEK